MRFESIERLPKKIRDIIEELKVRNQRFQDGNLSPKDFVSDRKEFLTSQHPWLTILTCSDSRVVPHYIFDCGLGEIFVIRKAGNIVEQTALGSIEFSSAILGSTILLILGHESCGAVDAGLKMSENLSPGLNSINDAMLPVLSRVAAYDLPHKEKLDLAIKENVVLQMKRAFEISDVIQDLIHNHKLFIIGGLYWLESGRVDFLDQAIVSRDFVTE